MLAAATSADTVRIWKLRPSPAAYGKALTSNFDSDYNFLTTRVDSVGVNSLTFSPDGETLSAINADPNKDPASYSFLRQASLWQASSGRRDANMLLCAPQLICPMC
jgi:WD40 repeat protein